MVPPDLCRTVCWASREGGLYLHKLHTARLRPRRVKTKKWLWRISSFCCEPQHLTCTPELCVPCGFSPLPSGLPLVNMVLFTVFSSYKRLLSLFFLSHGWFFSQSTNPFWNFPRLDAGVQNGKTFQEPTAQGFFNQKKKVNLTSHFRTAFFTCIWTMWNLSFSCRVNIIYLSNNWTD